MKGASGHQRALFLLLVVLASMWCTWLPVVAAWQVGRWSHCGTPESNVSFQRRKVIALPWHVFLASSVIPAQKAGAVMQNSQTVFQVGVPLSQDEAKDRFREGRKSLQYLIDHYDEICEGGGDNVRRYLGTVGTTSGLYGISRVMKTLMEQADDIVEYTETMTEVEKTIQQADGSAYMAIFTTSSTSGVPPDKYFKDALIEIRRCAQSMDELAKLANFSAQ